MARAVQRDSTDQPGQADVIPYLVTDLIGDFELARDDAFKFLYGTDELQRTPLRDYLLRLIYRSWVKGRRLTVGELIGLVATHGKRGQVMPLLDEMVRHGVIDRRRPRLGDKREVIISATPKLIRFYRDLMPKLVRNTEDSLAKLKRDVTVINLKSALSPEE